MKLKLHGTRDQCGVTSYQYGRLRVATRSDSMRHVRQGSSNAKKNNMQAYAAKVSHALLNQQRCATRAAKSALCSAAGHAPNNPRTLLYVSLV